MHSNKPVAWWLVTASLINPASIKGIVDFAQFNYKIILYYLSKLEGSVGIVHT